MKKGFTLIEVLMLVIIIGILAGIGLPVIMETVDAWSFSSKFQDNAVSQGIVAMSRMSREIRRLKDDGSVATANATQFSFTDLGNNSIFYTQSLTNLNRNSDTLADIESSSLAYTYYGDNGAAIATPIVSPNNTNIRRISIFYNVLAGSNVLAFQFGVRPQNIRRLNEKFK